MLFIPHGSLAQYGHLGHCVLLQHLERAPTWSQQLSNEVELKKNEKICFSFLLSIRFLEAFQIFQGLNDLNLDRFNLLL